MAIIWGPLVGRPPQVAQCGTPEQQPVSIQQITGETGNLLQFLDNTGVVLSAVDTTGAFVGPAATGAVTLTPATTARNTIQPTVDNSECLVLKAHSPTQSVRLMEWEKSDGTLIGGIGPGGSCIFKGFAVGANPKSANYVANGTDHYVPVDATAGPVTVTLPAAAVATPFGFQLQVTKVDATANTVTVLSAGADTFVGGGTNLFLNVQGDSALFQSDGVSVWSASVSVRARQVIGSQVTEPDLRTFITEWGAQNDEVVAIGPTSGIADLVGQQASGASAGRGYLQFITYNPSAPGGSRTWNYFRLHGSAVLDNAGLISGESLAIEDGNGFALINLAKSKAAFFGATPVNQQANASQAAITAVTDANAKGALQAIYNLLTNYGLAPATA